MKTSSLYYSFFGLCAASIAGAATIDWHSPPHSFNLAAGYTEMDASFRFELGVFREGFVPTEENMHEWSAHWQSAQRIRYHEGNRWFTGVHRVRENEAPFLRGTPAWIWGFAGDPEEGDWVLFRRSDWRWPAAAPFNPVLIHWNTAEADLVIAGSLRETPDVLMRAGAVSSLTPPRTTWAQFLSEEGLLPGQEALIRFATGSERPDVAVSRDAEGRWEIAVPRRADRFAPLLLEVSENLRDWRPAESAHFEVIRETPSGLVLRRPVSGGVTDASALFFRLAVSQP